MRFSGKTVYVTQANTAQGEALALRFASEGATLVLGSGFPTALVSVLIVLHCVFLMVNMNRWAKQM